MKHCKSKEFLSNFECQAPHKRKNPLLKTFWRRFCTKQHNLSEKAYDFHKIFTCLPSLGLAGTSAFVSEPRSTRSFLLKRVYQVSRQSWKAKCITINSTLSTDKTSIIHKLGLLFPVKLLSTKPNSQKYFDTWRFRTYMLRFDPGREERDDGGNNGCHCC